MKIHFVLFLAAIWITCHASAAPGDTLHVITHHHVTVVTDPSKGINPYPGWGVFPPAENPVRKMVMHVKFGCPDTMRCADWDYSDRISIRRQGGVRGVSQDYELGRMLTPYGGAFGKDWTFQWEVDVTDFSMILRDSVEVEYNHSGYEPNNDRGWAITIDFEIITGIPACEPVAIQKIYDDHFPYGDSLNPIEKKLSQVTFTAAPTAAFARVRVVQTGHGMDEPDGCGEFCNKYREIWYDGTLIDSRSMWKKCGDNPLYPQAGTWIYDRANWCPGYLVQPDLYDLSLGTVGKNNQDRNNYGSKGISHSRGSGKLHEKVHHIVNSHTIYFAMQSYSSPKPSANEVISAYMIQYRTPACEYDASVEDILVPSLKPIHKRLNPAAANPRIVVKNSGSREIRNMIIQYGTPGFEKHEFAWTGSLMTGKSVIVNLPGTINSVPGENKFQVTVLKPDGMKDEYPDDNTLTVPFIPAPAHDTVLVFYLLTNNEPGHNGYQVTSADGTVIRERKSGTLAAATVYRDTLKLPPGAYQLSLTDTAGDGLEFWYNTKGGRGVARLMDGKGNLVRSFESDCGSGWIYNFRTGPKPDNIRSGDYAIGLYPTRTSDKTTLDYFGNRAEDVLVKLVTDPGGTVVEEHHYPQLKEGMFTYDLTRQPKGRFYLKVIVNGQEIFNKRIRYIDDPEQQPDFAYKWPADSAVSVKLHQWQDWKFGVIIHWGAYSQWGVVESWSLCPEDEDWCIRRGPYSDVYYRYTAAYEKIRETFNPVKFNPGNWARAAKDAGMKYVVFTTKHHDGFCMFDSKYTDYKITDSGSIFSANPQSNVVKEVFNAFRQQGMGIGAYFSKPDWHSDDYWWPYFPVFDRNVNYDPARYPDRWKSFQKFTYNQIEELMKSYGNIDILWLDGGWVRPAGSLTDETRPWLGKHQWIQDVDIPKIAGMARMNQPGLLIVDRTVHGEFENYRTPEQQIPETIPNYPWESCITLGDSWYSTGPGERYKSVTWAIHTLIQIVAKGGNLLLGIGPDKTGELVPQVYERLKGIGEWMKVNSQAIYNSRPLAPHQQGNFCFTQSKDGHTKFIFYLLKEGEPMPDRIELPEKMIGSITEIGLLGNQKKLTIQFKKDKKIAMIPESFRHKMASTPALVFIVSAP